MTTSLTQASNHEFSTENFGATLDFSNGSVTADSAEIVLSVRSQIMGSSDLREAAAHLNELADELDRMQLAVALVDFVEAFSVDEKPGLND